MSSPFIMYILDCMSGIEGIEHKKMFGAFGLYKNGILFGIIEDERVFFKVDESSQSDYEEFDSKPLIFSADGSREGEESSYYEVPLDILEDPKSLEEWVNKSVEISKNSK